MEKIYYKSYEITDKYKKTKNFFYIEELFTGDFDLKAPRTLRSKVDSEILENIEMDILGFYGNPVKSKIVFKNYTEFRRNLEEIGLNIKHYINSI